MKMGSAECAGTDNTLLKSSIFGTGRPGELRFDLALIPLAAFVLYCCTALIIVVGDRQYLLGPMHTFMWNWRARTQQRISAAPIGLTAPLTLKRDG
jgi:hypothetical protein